MTSQRPSLRLVTGLALSCAVLGTCSSSPQPPGDPFEGQSNRGGYPIPITPTSTSTPGTSPPAPSATRSLTPTTPAPVPVLHVDAGFLTARYDCTWPPPADDDGREVFAPQENWTNARKTIAPVDTSSYRYTADVLHGGAEADLVQAWRTSFTNFVRVKAKLTGPRSVQVWVTVPEVPTGYDQKSRVIATPKELVSKYMTVSRSKAADIPGSCRISEGGRPLPPRAVRLKDDTATWH